MAKWYGKIGFITTSETSPGVWTEKIETRNYYGDIIRNARRWDSMQDSINSNISVTNEVSVISDGFIRANLGAIKYIEFMGSLWNISNVTVDYPRLTLSLGGLYNGETD